MNGTVWVEAGLCLAFSVLLVGCGAKATVDPRAEAPPPAVIEQDQDVNLVKVDHPEQFPVATATARAAASSVPRASMRNVSPARVSRTPRGSR